MSRFDKWNILYQQGEDLYSIFVSASHLTGLDTRSMTQRSIIVDIRGGEGWAQAEAQPLFDYAAYWPT